MKRLTPAVQGAENPLSIVRRVRETSGAYADRQKKRVLSEYQRGVLVALDIVEEALVEAGYQA